MKRYEYVTIACHGFLAGVFETHREIIDDYASRGYRYAGFIPTKQRNGFIVEIDLIFEQDIEEK